MGRSKYASQTWMFAILYKDGTRTTANIRAKYQSVAFSKIEKMFQDEMDLVLEIGLMGVS